MLLLCVSDALVDVVRDLVPHLASRQQDTEHPSERLYISLRLAVCRGKQGDDPLAKPAHGLVAYPRQGLHVAMLAHVRYHVSIAG